MQKSKVIVIGGPTASGKTALSIELAKQINGEIVSADSMQIYKDMNIGTAKPTKEEMSGIKHYLIDFVSPEEIIEKGKTPIIVGGTGLYIDSLIYEIEYPKIEIDLKYREELQERVKREGLEKLYEEAKKIDPVAMEKISVNDEKRTLRVLEIYHQTGKKKSQLDKESRKEPEYDYKVFIITMDREKLYERINKRVDIMIQEGLIKEVEDLCKKYKDFPTAMQGLGYKEVVKYLKKQISKEEMVEKIKQESRRYAKRQLTWFRKEKNNIWIDGTNEKQKNIDLILKELNNSGEEIK